MSAKYAYQAHDAVLGGFLFEGKVVMNAEVERQDEPSGVSMRFGGMKFIDEDKAFKAPKLTESSHCWIGDAKIELTRLFVMEGGTDEAGEWPMKSRVLKTGKFRSCIPVVD